jgi:hypothetical protein
MTESRNRIEGVARGIDAPRAGYTSRGTVPSEPSAIERTP